MRKAKPALINNALRIIRQNGACIMIHCDKDCPVFHQRRCTTLMYEERLEICHNILRNAKLDKFRDILK